MCDFPLSNIVLTFVHYLWPCCTADVIRAGGSILTLAWRGWYNTSLGYVSCLCSESWSVCDMCFTVSFYMKYTWAFKCTILSFFIWKKKLIRLNVYQIKCSDTNSSYHAITLLNLEGKLNWISMVWNQVITSCTLCIYLLFWFWYPTLVWTLHDKTRLNSSDVNKHKSTFLCMHAFIIYSTYIFFLFHEIHKNNSNICSPTWWKYTMCDYKFITTESVVTSQLVHSSTWEFRCF